MATNNGNTKLKQQENKEDHQLLELNETPYYPAHNHEAIFVQVLTNCRITSTPNNSHFVQFSADWTKQVTSYSGHAEGGGVIIGTFALARRLRWHFAGYRYPSGLCISCLCCRNKSGLCLNGANFTITFSKSIM